MRKNRKFISRLKTIVRSASLEILEPAEATLDDVAPFIGPLAEAMERNPVGLVWNDRLGAAVDDLGAKAVGIVCFVRNEGRHGWRQLQQGQPRGNICVLPRSEMKCPRPAITIRQRVDFRDPSTTRAADRLLMLPLFRRLPSDAP